MRLSGRLLLVSGVVFCLCRGNLLQKCFRFLVTLANEGTKFLPGFFSWKFSKSWPLVVLASFWFLFAVNRSQIMALRAKDFTPASRELISTVSRVTKNGTPQPSEALRIGASTVCENLKSKLPASVRRERCYGRMLLVQVKNQPPDTLISLRHVEKKTVGFYQ